MASFKPSGITYSSKPAISGTAFTGWDPKDPGCFYLPVKDARNLADRISVQKDARNLTALEIFQKHQAFTQPTTSYRDAVTPPPVSKPSDAEYNFLINVIHQMYIKENPDERLTADVEMEEASAPPKRKLQRSQR